MSKIWETSYGLYIKVKTPVIGNFIVRLKKAYQVLFKKEVEIKFNVDYLTKKAILKLLNPSKISGGKSE